MHSITESVTWKVFLLLILYLVSSRVDGVSEGVCDVFLHSDVQLQLTGPIPDERKHSISVDDIESCSKECCDDVTCDVALFVDKECVLVNCSNVTVSACQPFLATNENADIFVKGKNTTLIYVNNRNTSASQENLVSPSIFDSVIKNSLMNLTADNETLDDNYNTDLNRNISSQIIVDTNDISNQPSPTNITSKSNDSFAGLPIKPSSQNLQLNETMNITAHLDSSYNESVAAIITNLTANNNGSAMETTPASILPPTPAPIKLLHLKVTGNTTIRLPTDSVVLKANVDGTPTSPTGYNYDWLLIDHPKNDKGKTTMDDDTLTLSTLSAGRYKFKVTVTDTNAHGEEFVNITVLKPLRVNTPPVAVISPPTQKINLPIESAILDGTNSNDDDGIVSYHWEMTSSPLEARKQLEKDDQPVLQLHNLVEGYYEFQLTVTDKDGASNSTKADITVKPKIDNKPIANAGSDQLIHLPQNSIVLYGNNSKDDYGIVSYRWSISPDSEKQVVDMQGARTYALKLSTLEAGEYTFQLTVTDTSGQEDTAKVTVNVQPEANHPPVANAGQDIQLLLPMEADSSLSVQLDGSKSTDDKGIKFVEWKQKSLSPTATIDSPHSLTTTISNIKKKGVYVFTLVVADEEGDRSNDDVSITVTEEQPPVANAGPDISMTLPDDVAVLSGRKSHDDYGIRSYLWTKEPQSPAVGRVLNHSDTTSQLMVADLEEGTFIFRLTVTNVRGKSSFDTAIVKVLPDPLLKYLVELHLTVPSSSFNEGSKILVAKQLHLLLSLMDSHEVLIRSVYSEHRTGDLVMLFYVKLSPKTYMPAVDIVKTLNSKLKSDVPLLDVSVKLVDTYVCENNCSGHGQCHAGSKQCECNMFWMENFIRVYMFDGVRNCDWSVLYVIIVSFIILICLFSVGYFLVCLCLKKRRRKPVHKRRKRNYSPIQNGDYQKLPLKKHKNGVNTKIGQMTNAYRSSSLMRSMTSSTSSDEDETVFEKRKLIHGSTRRLRSKSKSKQAPLVEFEGVNGTKHKGFDGLGLDKELALHEGEHSDDDVV